MKPQGSDFHSISSASPLVLIPAAGFGTRVGSPAAKELLPGPDQSPLIAFGLEQARCRGWPVHVITRKEKVELIQYLQDYRKQTGLQLEIQIIEPSREWPETLLRSEPFWHDRNLLCLPDTVFKPVTIWDQLANSSADIVAAVFRPADLSTWGAFEVEGKADSHPLSDHQSQLAVCEKPKDRTDNSKDRMAWGLLAWKRSAGRALLTAQLESGQDHHWRKLNHSFESFPLQSFDDVTRGALK